MILGAGKKKVSIKEEKGQELGKKIQVCENSKMERESTFRLTQLSETKGVIRGGWKYVRERSIVTSPGRLQIYSLLPTLSREKP